MTKRKAKSAARAVPVPRGPELKRLESLCAYAKAHARAKAAGALGAPRPRKPARPRTLTPENVRANVEKRLEMLVELEVRWRLAELGIPYTDGRVKRFQPFRFDSDHRRRLETLYNNAQLERMRRKWAKEAEEKANEHPPPGAPGSTPGSPPSPSRGEG